MRVRTRALTGAALDWVMAKIQGAHRAYLTLPDFLEYRKEGKFQYSTEWAKGGPLIDKKAILFHGSAGAFTAWIPGVEGAIAVGETHLIAAMRCLAAGELGEEVEIPEELIGAS